MEQPQCELIASERLERRNLRPVRELRSRFLLIFIRRWKRSPSRKKFLLPGSCVMRLSNTSQGNGHCLRQREESSENKREERIKASTSCGSEKRQRESWTFGGDLVVARLRDGSRDCVHRG